MSEKIAKLADSLAQAAASTGSHPMAIADRIVNDKSVISELESYYQENRTKYPFMF